MNSLMKLFEPGVVAHSFSPSTRGAEADFKAGLVYTEEPCLEKSKPNQNNKIVLNKVSKLSSHQTP